MNYYDEKNGWGNTKPGWYEVVLYVSDNPEVTNSKHFAIETWIKNNIGKYERHCRWMFDWTHLHYKFRYERDYIWFKLTWG